MISKKLSNIGEPQGIAWPDSSNVETRHSASDEILSLLLKVLAHGLEID